MIALFSDGTPIPEFLPALDRHESNNPGFGGCSFKADYERLLAGHGRVSLRRIHRYVATRRRATNCPDNYGVMAEVKAKFAAATGHVDRAMQAYELARKSANFAGKRYLATSAPFSAGTTTRAFPGAGRDQAPPAFEMPCTEIPVHRLAIHSIGTFQIKITTAWA